MLYNTKSKSGSVYHIFKNTKARASKTKSTNVVIENAEELKKLLADCIIEKSKKELKVIFQETIELRRSLIQSNDYDDFKDFFKMYFLDSDWVTCIRIFMCFFHFKWFVFIYSGVIRFYAVLRRNR